VGGAPPICSFRTGETEHGGGPRKLHSGKNSNSLAQPVDGAIELIRLRADQRWPPAG